MRNATAANQPRLSGAKLTIRVYTVNQAGIVSPPRTVVHVPHEHEPPPLATQQLPSGACPPHRPAGAIR